MAAFNSKVDMKKGTSVIKYKTYFNKIEASEVVRETEKQVVLPGLNGGRERRENKESDWINWHDSWEDAHAFLIKKAEQSVERLHMNLNRAKGELGQIKGMKPNAVVNGG